MAYARRNNASWVVVVIPFTEEVLQEETDISVALPNDAPRHWMNVFTNEKIESGNELNILPALKKFPVVVLTAELV